MKTLDERARDLYIRENRFTDPKNNWTPFFKLTDTEKDYWRALIQRSDMVLQDKGITNGYAA